MRREILCPKCGSDYFLLAVDHQHGFLMRRTEIAKCKTPPGLGVARTTIEGGRVTDASYEPHYSLLCDMCSCEIEEGTPILAATTLELEERK